MEAYATDCMVDRNSEAEPFRTGFSDKAEGQRLGVGEMIDWLTVGSMNKCAV